MDLGDQIQILVLVQRVVYQMSNLPRLINYIFKMKEEERQNRRGGGGARSGV